MSIAGINKVLHTSFFLFAFHAIIFGQIDYANARLNRWKIDSMIVHGISWKQILESGKKLNVLQEVEIKKINQTRDFIHYFGIGDRIDSFFLDLCENSYTDFPYGSSSNLNQVYYKINPKNGAEINIRATRRTGTRIPERSLYNSIRILFDQPRTIIISKLISYLSKDAITRTLIQPDIDYHYLKPMCFSDFALEVLEIYTMCDFYENNTSLFSETPSEEKADVIAKIQHWWTSTQNATPEVAMYFFLDSLAYPTRYPYFYTARNLEFRGDTLHARSYYLKYYYFNHNWCYPYHTFYGFSDSAEEKLLNAGENIPLQDCLHDLYDLRCNEQVPKCIELIFKYGKYKMEFETVADVIRLERTYQFPPGKRRDYPVWKMSLYELCWNSNIIHTPVILELLKIQDLLLANSISYQGWEQQYHIQVDSTFRVCDLAILKYCDLYMDDADCDVSTSELRQILIEKIKAEH